MISVTNIVLQNSYTYTINDQEKVLADVNDFTRGDCESIVEIYWKESDFTGYTLNPSFISVRTNNRTYRSI